MPVFDIHVFIEINIFTSDQISESLPYQGVTPVLSDIYFWVGLNIHI